MDFELLADELIQGCCGRHSVGLVYHFLLRGFDNNESAARGEFIRFLRGELSQEILNKADREIEKDHSPIFTQHPGHANALVLVAPT
jgi:hypothetical protein